MNSFDLLGTALMRCSARVGYALVLLCCVLSNSGMAQSTLNGPVFLAPTADHFLDPSSALGIEAVAAERDGVKFVLADGRVPNYGVQRGGVLWLRVRFRCRCRVRS